MIKKITDSLTWACIAFFPILVKAQSVDEIKSRYPGEEAVMLDHSLHYTIEIRDGKPYIQSDDQQKILYLSAHSAAYMSRYGFSHSSFHQLQTYEAYTKTDRDKKIKVTDFNTSDSKSGSIFYDDVKETTFDFPAISPGATGNLEVTMIHTDPHLLSPFFFAHYLPVVNSELKITFPKDMSIKYVLKGNDTSKVIVSRQSKHGENIYSFQMKDCPPDKRYADAPDDDWYSTHVVFYIEKFSDSNRSVSYLANLDDLYKLDYGYIKNINKEISPELKHEVDSLTKNASTEEEKARKIYSWVQQNIKYVAFEEGMEGFIPRDASLVCARRFGDCKDMSSILTMMLNAAGLKAYYTWIGTRNLPYTYSETPLPIVDNHMISTILLNGKYIFLDGTDPTCVFGMPSEGIQDKEALLSINETQYKILRVPTPSKETNQLIDSTLMELTSQGLRGQIAMNLSGYFAMNMHGLLSYTNANDREKYLKEHFNRGSNKFNLEKFEIGNQDDKNNIRLSGNFNLQDYAKNIAGDWYLNMNLFKFYEHQEIDYPKRKIPIEFNFFNTQKYITILKIPEGYTVSYLPQSKSYHNKVWGFDMKYEQKGNEVILTQEFDNEHLMLNVDQFEEWNKVLENLFPLYKETISLSKK